MPEFVVVAIERVTTEYIVRADSEDDARAMKDVEIIDERRLDSSGVERVVSVAANE